MLKTTLTVEIEYDQNLTDPEGLACAIDRLLETALSTPDIMSEYGNPKVGEFFIANETPTLPKPKIVLNISGGVLQDVFGSDPATEVILVDWDCEGCSPSDTGIVEIPDGLGGTRLAVVADYPVRPLTDLMGRDVDTAIAAAGLNWSTEADPATEVVRRWVIYDPDTNALLTTNVYGSYDQAVEDASQVNDVLILPLTYQNLHM